MTEPVVLDSSAVFALIADGGPTNAWLLSEVSGRGLAAPELAMYETADVLRRQAAGGRLSQGEASLALVDLHDLAMQLWPYAATRERAWQLRHTVTAYDASHVALAEMLGTALLTLDRRLARSFGPACPVLVPPSP